MSPDQHFLVLNQTLPPAFSGNVSPKGWQQQHSCVSRTQGRVQCVDGQRHLPASRGNESRVHVLELLVKPPHQWNRYWTQPHGLQPAPGLQLVAFPGLLSVPKRRKVFLQNYGKRTSLQCQASGHLTLRWGARPKPVRLLGAWGCHCAQGDNLNSHPWCTGGDSAQITATKVSPTALSSTSF